MKKTIVFLIILALSSFCGTQSTTYAQGSKVIGAAIKKVTKTATKKAAKEVGKKEVTKSSKLVNSALRHSAKRTIKSRGYKSFLGFSKNESREILSHGKVSLDRTGINKNFESKYSQSISKGLIKKLSPKKLVAPAVLQYLPVGAKAIKTKWDRNKKGFVPAFDDRNLSPEAAKQLFAERRKAIAPHNQFATKEQLKNYDKKAIVVGKEKDATVLKNNMFSVMDPNVEKQVNAFGGVAAHHVIPGNDPHAKGAREILKKFEIDINGPENGIFLPTDNKSIYKGIIHNTNHSPKYSKEIHIQLKKCKSREEVIDVLEKVKHDLYNGKLSLKDGVNEVNKNL